MESPPQEFHLAAAEGYIRLVIGTVVFEGGRMKIMRALPWFVSSVCLLIAAACACYVMWLDYDRQTSALANAMRSQLATIERLRTEVTALRTAGETERTRIDYIESCLRDSVTASINFSTRLNQTRRDVNDLWASLFGAADAKKVSANFSQIDARLRDLAQAAAKDVANLHARIDATQKPSRSLQKPDAFVNDFLAQPPRAAATP
jgi:hypothetical protein